MSNSLNMQHVAEAAGVSKSAVSLALRDDPRLALATRRRVQEVAARMGYRKNPIIASLMSQLRVSQTPLFQANFALINCSSTRTLFDLPSFAEYRRGLRERADLAGFGVEEFWTEEPGLGGLTRLRQILLTRNIRGLVLALPFERRPTLAGLLKFFSDFSIATIGSDRTEPLLHRVTNDHFETARGAVEQLFDVGYTRPGIVLMDEWDQLLRRRFSAGFQSAIYDHARNGARVVSPLLLSARDQSLFVRWLKAEKPDVILTPISEVRDWLRVLKIEVPGDLGLLHLDWHAQLRDWAGMRQSGERVGSVAAEIVIDQIAQNESGIPDFPRLILVQSVFVPGPSLLMRGATSPVPAAVSRH